MTLAQKAKLAVAVVDKFPKNHMGNRARTLVILIYISEAGEEGLSVKELAVKLYSKTNYLTLNSTGGLLRRLAKHDLLQAHFNGKYFMLDSKEEQVNVFKKHAGMKFTLSDKIKELIQ